MPFMRMAVVAAVIVAVAFVCAACAVDLSGASPSAAAAREYIMGIAVILGLTSAYAYFRSGDDDNRGSGDRSGA